MVELLWGCPVEYLSGRNFVCGFILGGGSLFAAAKQVTVSSNTEVSGGARGGVRIEVGGPKLCRGNSDTGSVLSELGVSHHKIPLSFHATMTWLSFTEQRIAGQ